MDYQAFLRKYFSWFVTPFTKVLGKIEWKQKKPLTDADRAVVMEMLKKNYYIIATRRGNHLSTFAISLANFVVSGKFSYWSHVLMNTEDEVQSPDDFRLIEATNAGSTFSSFEQVFGGVGSKPQAPDAVALLKPKSMEIEEWTAVLDKAKTQTGKPYDTLFDLADDLAVSCVELIRNILKANPNYDTDFAEFEKMINKAKNLTPQMFCDCPDFEVVFEIRK